MAGRAQAGVHDVVAKHQRRVAPLFVLLVAAIIYTAQVAPLVLLLAIQTTFTMWMPVIVFATFSGI